MSEKLTAKDVMYSDVEESTHYVIKLVESNKILTLGRGTSSRTVFNSASHAERTLRLFFRSNMRRDHYAVKNLENDTILGKEIKRELSISQNLTWKRISYVSEDLLKRLIEFKVISIEKINL